MAYPNAWDSNSFPGSSPAKALDDEIRKLRGQLEVRLEDVFIEDITADPWVPKAAFAGLQVGLTRIIPFAAFLSDLHAKENDLDLTGFITGFVSTGSDLAAPLGAYIPLGVHITKLEWLVDKVTANSVDCKLYSRPFVNTAPAVTIVNTTSVTVAGANIVASTDMDIEILPDVMYWLGVKGVGVPSTSYRLYGCRVTFNRDSIAHAT